MGLHHGLTNHVRIFENRKDTVDRIEFADCIKLVWHVFLKINVSDLLSEVCEYSNGITLHAKSSLRYIVCSLSDNL